MFLYPEAIANIVHKQNHLKPYSGKVSIVSPQNINHMDDKDSVKRRFGVRLRSHSHRCLWWFNMFYTIFFLTTIKNKFNQVNKSEKCYNLR